METLTVTPKEEALPEDLKAIVIKLKKKKRKSLRILEKYIVIVMAMLISVIFHPLIHNSTMFLMISFLALVGYEIFLSKYDRIQRERGAYGIDKQDIEQLSASNDKRIIGILLDQNQYSTLDNIPLKREALLKRLLLTLNAEDAHLLTRRQKFNLFFDVRPDGSGITFEALKALEQVGDTSTLVSLTRWRFNNDTRTVKPEVIEAYKSCLAAIEARAASTRSDAQLLRPSFSTDGADTYLRPVTQKIDENAETLLRSDLTPRSPLPVPSCLGEEGEIHEETVGEDVRESKP